MNENRTLYTSFIPFCTLVLPLLVATFLPVATTSCSDPVGCDELGCPHNKICDQASGHCTLPGKDCVKESNICLTNQICNPTTRRCQNAISSCAATGQCSPGQVCNFETGLCEVPQRCSITGCPPAQQCDHSTDKCTDISCNNDRECPHSGVPVVCSGQICKQGCRPGSVECPKNRVCLIEAPGETTGVCRSPCQQDQDCPFGSTCIENPATASTKCTPEPPCTLDTDCRTDESCIKNRCQQPTCSSNNDCPSSTFCNTKTGVCTVTNCVDDRFATSSLSTSNLSFDVAHPIENTGVPLNELVLCPATEDWFKFVANASGTLRVTLNQAGSDADIDLQILTPNHQLLAENLSKEQRSVTSIFMNRGSTIYIRLFSNTFVDTQYSLLLETISCSGDSFEPNNTKSTASRVANPQHRQTRLTLSLCPGDTDWFLLPSLDANSTLEINLGSGPTNLDGTLYTPNGSILPFSRENHVKVDLLGNDGDYYLKILSTDNGTGNYNLTIALKDPPKCPFQGTATTSKTAVKTSATQEFTLCPVPVGKYFHFEEKWVALDTLPSTDAIYTIKVTAKNPPKDLAMTLAVKKTTTVETVRSTTFHDGTATIVAELKPSKWSYFLRLISRDKVSMLKSYPTFRVSLTP